MKVRRKDLEQLTTEVMQMRDFLPRLLNAELTESLQSLKSVEKSESYLMCVACLYVGKGASFRG